VVSHYTAVLLRYVSQVNFEGGLYILHTNDRCSIFCMGCFDRLENVCGS